MKVLILDKVGWLRMFDPWLVDEVPFDKLVLQNFNCRSVIDMAFLPFLKKLSDNGCEISICWVASEADTMPDELSFMRIQSVSSKSKRSLTITDIAFWTIDMMRYQLEYFDRFPVIKTRPMDWLKFNPILKEYFLFFIRVIPKFLLEPISGLLFFIAIKFEGNRSNPLWGEFLLDGKSWKSVVALPYCHSSMLNYDQNLLAMKLMSLGRRVIAVPGSWDNLSNKGTPKQWPSELWVWNHIQQKEAVELSLNKKALKQVKFRIIGTIGMEKWEQMFCNETVLSQSVSCRVSITYACSSGGIIKDESHSITQLLEALEESSVDFHLTIRPHPKSKLDTTSFSNNPCVTIRDTRTADTTSEDKALLVQDLRNCHVLVGINTSLMVECACFGIRPVRIKDISDNRTRHPHEDIPLRNNFLIEFTSLVEFISELRSKSLFTKLRDEKVISDFRSEFGIDLGDGQLPSERFCKYLHVS